MLPAPAQSDTTTGTRQGTAFRDEVGPGVGGAELLDLLSDASNAANAGVVAADMAAHNMAQHQAPALLYPQFLASSHQPLPAHPDPAI